MEGSPTLPIVYPHIYMAPRRRRNAIIDLFNASIHELENIELRSHILRAPQQHAKPSPTSVRRITCETRAHMPSTVSLCCVGLGWVGRGTDAKAMLQSVMAMDAASTQVTQPGQPPSPPLAAGWLHCQNAIL